MAVSYLRSANGTDSNGGAISISLTGYNAGELFFASFEVYSQNGGTITPPAGFTLARRDECTQANTWSKATYWKVLSSGDISGGSLSFTVPATYTDYCYGAYSVSAGETLLNGTTYGSFAQGTGTAVTGASITSAPAGVLLWLKTGWNSGVTAAPSGMTDRQSQYDTSNHYADEAISAGTTGTRSATNGVSDEWSVQMLVIGVVSTAGPSITSQPSNAYVLPGATATFSVTASATGGGSLSYQWKKNGTNVSGGSGGTSASYTTGTLSLSDDTASYTCDVTETGGSNDGTVTSSAATLRVGILLVASSTAVYTATGTPTTIAPAWPTTAITSIDASAVGKVVLVIGMKPATSGAGSVTTPAGWTLVGSITAAGGYTAGGASAADTGNCDLYVYAIDDPGTVSGTLSVTVNVGATNGVAWARMQRYSAPPSTTFSLAIATGSDTSAGNVSITFGSDPGVTTGDRVLAAMCIPTDVTTPAQFSAEAITQTGVTYGTVTELEEPDSANNFDIGGFLVDALATAGPSSAAPVLTATAGGTTTNVRGPGIFLRLRAASGSSNTPMTISATQTQTPSRARALGANRSVTDTQTASRARALAEAKAGTHTQTGSRSSGVGLPRSGTHTQAGANVRNVGAVRSPTNTQTPSVSRLGVLARTLTATHSQVTSKLAALARTLGTATTTQTPSLIKGQGYFKSLSAVGSQVASLVRQVGAPKSATQTETATLGARAVGRGRAVTQTQSGSVNRAGTRTLSATTAQTPSRTRDVGRSVAATHAQTASRVRNVGKSQASTQTQVASAPVRALGRALLGVGQQTASRVRAVARSLGVTSAAVPSVDVAQGGRAMTLSATVQQVASRLRALGRPLAGTQAQVPSRQRAVARNAAATSSQAASVTKGSNRVLVLLATATQAPLRSLGLGIQRTAVALQSGALGRLLARVLGTTQAQAPTVSASPSGGGPVAPSPSDVLAESYVLGAVEARSEVATLVEAASEVRGDVTARTTVV